VVLETHQRYQFLLSVGTILYQLSLVNYERLKKVAKDKMFLLILQEGRSTLFRKRIVV